MQAVQPLSSEPRPARKWVRTLRAILERSASDNPRDWLNRFVAERVCGDHTLPSTVSELQREKGLVFERRDLDVVGYAGEPARVTAYRIAPQSLERARALLG